MRRLIMIGLIVLSSAVSCIKDYSASRFISVRVSTSDTKASAMTTQTLELLGNFVLNAYVDGQYYDYSGGSAVLAGNPGIYVDPGSQNTSNVYYHSGAWVINGSPKWIAGIKTRFYCHAPAVLMCADGCTAGERTNVVHKWNVSDEEDETSFSYSMPTPLQFNPITLDYHDADNCNDLIFAYADKNYDGSSDIVDLTFCHALACVNFAVSPNDGSFDTTLKIKSISINTIPSSGDCVFKPSASGNKFEWSNLGASESYTQTYNATFASCPKGWTAGTYVKDSQNYSIYSANNSFFVIPHTLNGTQLTIVFDDAGTDISRTVTIDVPGASDKWEAGKYYKYKIGATVLGREISVDVTLDEWQNFDDKLII